MPRRLRFTHEARDDLNQTRAWFSQPGAGAAARRRLALIRADIRQLKKDPYLYPVGQHDQVRELPCAGGYRVLYEVHPDTGRSSTAGDVLVLRVFGPGQSRDQL